MMVWLETKQNFMGHFKNKDSRLKFVDILSITISQIKLITKYCIQSKIKNRIGYAYRLGLLWKLYTLKF